MLIFCSPLLSCLSSSLVFRVFFSSLSSSRVFSLLSPLLSSLLSSSFGRGMKGPGRVTSKAPQLCCENNCRNIHIYDETEQTTRSHPVEVSAILRETGCSEFSERFARQYRQTRMFFLKVRCVRCVGMCSVLVCLVVCWCALLCVVVSVCVWLWLWLWCVAHTLKIAENTKIYMYMPASLFLLVSQKRNAV